MTISNFNDAFAQICDIEGGYVDNPDDPGGATMYGITQAVAQANGYMGAMQDLPLSTAQTIAKTQYWDRFMCDQFDPRIGYLIFDSAFNGGHPVQWLQQAAGVATDGVIGAQTIGAVRNLDPRQVCMRFNAYHAQYYASLKNFTFIDGWVNRIAANLLVCAQ
jgi:lysozyme family protein